MRRLVPALLLALATALASALGAVPRAVAAGPTPTTTTLVAPTWYADAAASVQVAVAAGETPLADVPVALDRRVDGTWRPEADLVTDDTGRATASVTLSRDPADNVFRASYAGDATYAASTSGPVSATLRRRSGHVGLTGPDRVVDESRVQLTTSWRTGNGVPVPGAVEVYRFQHGSWAWNRTLQTGADGVASFSVRPRHDTRWKAVAAGLPWVTGDTSPVHHLDNVPRMAPVRLPAGAPAPRIPLPKQARATGAGANVVVTRIPDGVWADMVGRSWHRGCPVGRSGLRLVRANYWAYDGYRRRGELVVAAGAADQFAKALRLVHERRLPLRSMYRVDRFGWSSRLQGADDYKSMAAGNTSAFNCRWVVGKPGVRSPHSYGRSFDVNPWENPYRSRDGWVPNSWWVGRSHPQVAWRDRSHLMVRSLSEAGFAWTYGVADAHHFDARTSYGRIVVAEGCGDAVCH